MSKSGWMRKLELDRLCDREERGLGLWGGTAHGKRDLKRTLKAL